MTRDEIITQVSQLLGDLLLEGSVDTADRTYIADTDLVFDLTNRLKGKEVYFLVGTNPNMGEVRAIKSYGVGTLEVTPSLSVAPTTGQPYHIYEHFRYKDYQRTIEESVRQARERYLIDMEATLALIATAYEYCVPSGFRYVHDIWVVPSSSVPTSVDYADQDSAFRLPRNSWQVKAQVSGSRVIAFDPRIVDLDDWNEETIRVMGQRRPAELGATQSCEIPEGYVINKSLAMLALRRIGEGPKWPQMFGYYASEASRLERQINTSRRSNSVEV